MPKPSSIAEVVRRAAKAQGVTQRQLADAAGVTDRTIRDWLNGRSHGIGLSTVEAVMARLGLEMDARSRDEA